MRYGEKFKYARELRKLTLQELSVKCSLSIPYLSDIERGKKRPAMKSLERIANALSVDAWFFMDDKAISLSELTKISGYDPPDDIIEFFSKSDSLPYAVLARDLHNEQIDPIFLRELLESIKKMKSR